MVTLHDYKKISGQVHYSSGAEICPVFPRLPGFYAVLLHLQRTGWYWESSITLRCTTLSWHVVLYIIKWATYWGASCHGRTLLSWSGRKLTVPKRHWWVSRVFTPHGLVWFGLKIVHQSKQQIYIWNFWIHCLSFFSSFADPPTLLPFFQLAPDSLSGLSQFPVSPSSF